MTSTEDFIAEIAELLEEGTWEAGQQIADSLSIRYACECLNCTEELDYFQLVNVISPFDQLLPMFVKVVLSLRKQDYAEAYRTQALIVQTYAKEILQKWKDNNFFLPIGYRFSFDLLTCAKLADTSSESASSDSFLEQAAGPIMECYRSCVADIRSSIECSKRMAMLNLTNALFRIYFRINRLNLLKPLVRAIENCGTLYDHFSMADKVTFHYYLGRKAIISSEFKLADDSLSFAFSNCLPSCRKNQRLILICLIPVKIYLGHLPSRNLLEKYNLLEFVDVAEAVRQGNVRKLYDAMNQHEKFFVKSGVILMLEKLKFVACRTLFKKTCAIINSPQVPLRALGVALNLAHPQEMNADEVECLVANLIFQGRIKGYLSHQHQKLVVSKLNAFPRLSTANS